MRIHPSLPALFFFILSFASKTTVAQTVGDYRSNGSGGGAWTAAATWLTWNGSAYIAAGAAPANTTNNIIIQTGDAVLLTVAQTVTQLTVQTGGSLNQSAASTINLAGNIMVDGTLTASGGFVCGTYTVAGTGTFTLGSGATLNIGSAAGIASSGATGNIQTTVRSFSTAANYTYTGTAAQATGTGLPSGVTGAVTVNNTNAVSGLTLSASITVNTPGTVTVPSGSVLTCPNSRNILGSGSFSLAAGATLFIGSNVGISTIAATGNVQVTGGKTFSSAANYTYYGNVAQQAGNALPTGLTGTVRFTNTNGSGTSLTGNVVVTSPGVITVMGAMAASTNIISGTGTFTLNPGGTLLTAHPQGIDAAGLTGSIQTAAFTFPTTANYTYYGSGTQATGTGLPGTVTSLYINGNTGGTINLTANTTITGALTLNNGTFCLNGNTITVFSIARNTGTLSLCDGVLNFSGTATVTYTGANPITTGSELPSTLGALVDLTINGSGKVVTLGQDVTINNALTMTAGSLALGGYQLIYSPSARLVYNGAAAQTTGIEWPDAGFDRPVQISNTFTGTGVSLPANKTGYNSTLTVLNGGHFNSAGFSLSGPGNIAVNSGGTYITPHPDGASMTGAIQLTGTRTFAAGSSYHFNGTVPQVTGTEMPASVTNITVNNPTGVQLLNPGGGALTIRGTLNLISGVFDAATSALNLTFQTGNTPLVRTSGTLTTAPTSTLQFGTAGNTGGNAITLPNNVFTTPPTFANVGVNRTNALTLGNQAITVNNTLILTLGVLDVGIGTLILQNGNTPITRTTGTLTVGINGSLHFGAAGNTGGAAFTLPASLFTAAPTMNNLTINRTNTLTLGTQAVTVAGSLNLVSGVLAIGNNTLGLNGSLNITGGSLTGGATSNLSVGGAAATISLPVITGHLNNLTIARPNSGSTPSANLSANLMVAGTLNLSGGSVSLGAAHLTTGAISNYNENRFVVTANNPTSGGYLVRNVAATPVVFPVGTSSYTPAIVDNSGTADAFRVRVFNGLLSGGTTGGTDPNSVHAVNRTWLVEETVTGGSNATLTLQWNTTDENPSFARTSSYIGHHNGTVWDATSTAVATAVSAGVWSLTRSGLSSFSPFSVQDNLIALPVTWLSFTAQKTAQSTVLNWQTRGNKLIVRFEVQRSTNGRDFTAVGGVTGAGASNSLKAYNYIDNTHIASPVYYRIKAMDAGGGTSFSAVRKFSGAASGFGAVYPVPVSSTAYLPYWSAISGNRTFLIRDAAGRTVRSVTTAVVVGNNLLALDAAVLPKGIYAVSCMGEAFVARFVK